VLGMTICYDLRFPYLYRDLAHAGATMLSIP
jgi:deaminated glutathione amidase